MENNKSFIIDGHSLIYRIYYATINQMQFYLNNNLQPLNVLKLMLLTVMKIIKNNNYSYGLIAFDIDKKSLDRYKEYNEYRKPMPNDLSSQIPLIIDALNNHLGVKTYQKIGLEADDVIGSYSSLMNKSNIHCDIYTSDKDMLQLVNELTTVHLFKVGVSVLDTITNENFYSKYSLKPHQIIDLKIITCITCDNF